MNNNLMILQLPGNKKISVFANKKTINRLRLELRQEQGLRPEMRRSTQNKQQHTEQEV